MTVFWIILLLAALYAAGLWWLARGFDKLSDTQASRVQPAGILDGSIETGSTEAQLPSVAICVAARNEAANLPRLLDALKRQDYPPEKLEICIVDDRSNDETPAILERAAAEIPGLRSLRITMAQAGYAPKKRALDTAIRATQGEIILLTDADCSPPPGWTSAMASHYAPDIVCGAGYSPYRFDTRLPGLIEGMLALDFFSLAAVSAAGIGRQLPLSAAGTNFSYRRTAFLASGGFEPIREWISGDDDLMLHQIAAAGSGRFFYAICQDSHVPGAAPSSWRQFVQQRLRYASKGLHYRPALTLGLAGVYFLNLGIALVPVLAALGLASAAVGGLSAWVVKSIAEYTFLRRAAKMFGEQQLLRWYLPTALLHPYYISVFALLGVKGGFTWKDARTARRSSAARTADV